MSDFDGLLVSKKMILVRIFLVSSAKALSGICITFVTIKRLSVSTRWFVSYSVLIVGVPGVSVHNPIWFTGMTSGNRTSSCKPGGI